MHGAGQYISRADMGGNYERQTDTIDFNTLLGKRKDNKAVS
jgi:hypothetical protein